VVSLTLPLRAAGRNSAMQADKSVLCDQALGARQTLASTALRQASRRKGMGYGVIGWGVMVKIP
jgi:hypothetical protein